MVPLEVFRELPKTLGTERYPCIWKLFTYLDHSEKAQDSRAEVLRRAAVILWDEASQISDVVLDCVNRLLRDLTRIAKPFGGKIIVMGYDFPQILPVVPRASEAGIIAHTVLQHYAMRDGTFRKYALTENIRLRLSAGEDTSHRDWLLRLGSGDCPSKPTFIHKPLSFHITCVCLRQQVWRRLWNGFSLMFETELQLVLRAEIRRMQTLGSVSELY